MYNEPFSNIGPITFDETNSRNIEHCDTIKHLMCIIPILLSGAMSVASIVVLLIYGESMNIQQRIYLRYSAATAFFIGAVCFGLHCVTRYNQTSDTQQNGLQLS